MESKTVIYTPDSGAAGSGAGMLGMLAPLLQKSGLDPNLLLAMNRNLGGFGGEGGWFIWVIFLFFLMGWGNGGWERIDPVVRIENGETYNIDTLLRYLKATDIYIFFSEKK